MLDPFVTAGEAAATRQTAAKQIGELVGQRKDQLGHVSRRVRLLATQDGIARALALSGTCTGNA